MQNITYIIILKTSNSAICKRILEFHGKNGIFLSSLVKLKLSKLIFLWGLHNIAQNKIFCWVKFKTPKTFALCCHPSSVHPSVFTLFQLFFFFFSCKITPDTKRQKFHKKCNFATKSIKLEFFFEKMKTTSGVKKEIKNVDFFLFVGNNC